MERIWLIVASLLMIAAAGFFWRNNLSAAFLTAASGAVAWFLSYRTKLSAQIAASERNSEKEITEEPDEE
jgi:hypothetical protein